MTNTSGSRCQRRHHHYHHNCHQLLGTIITYRWTPTNFQRSEAGDPEYKDYYVWADPAPGGGPPNNWLSKVKYSIRYLTNRVRSKIPQFFCQNSFDHKLLKSHLIRSEVLPGLGLKGVVNITITSTRFPKPSNLSFKIWILLWCFCSRQHNLTWTIETLQWWRRWSMSSTSGWRRVSMGSV